MYHTVRELCRHEFWQALLNTGHLKADYRAASKNPADKVVISDSQAVGRGVLCYNGA